QPTADQFVPRPVRAVAAVRTDLAIGPVARAVVGDHGVGHRQAAVQRMDACAVATFEGAEALRAAVADLEPVDPTAARAVDHVSAVVARGTGHADVTGEDRRMGGPVSLIEHQLGPGEASVEVVPVEREAGAAIVELAAVGRPVAALGHPDLTVLAHQRLVEAGLDRGLGVEPGQAEVRVVAGRLIDMNDTAAGADRHVELAVAVSVSGVAVSVSGIAVSVSGVSVAGIAVAISGVSVSVARALL